jgi:hypothetical protein
MFDSTQLDNELSRMQLPSYPSPPPLFSNTPFFEGHLPTERQPSSERLSSSQPQPTESQPQLAPRYPPRLQAPSERRLPQRQGSECQPSEHQASGHQASVRQASERQASGHQASGRQFSQHRPPPERCPPTSLQTGSSPLLSTSTHKSHSGVTESDSLFECDSPVVTSDMSESFRRLESYTRRWYITTFSNQNVEQPIQAAFPYMSPNHAVYRQAVQRVRSLYKSYKSRTLQDAEKWFSRWLAGKGNGNYAAETSFKVLKGRLSGAFQLEWLSQVFTWATSSIDFKACTPRGRRFLKCK